PAKITKVDFLAKCRKLYADEPAPGPGAGRVAPPAGPAGVQLARPGRLGRFGLFDDPCPSGKPGEEPDLVLAAWLHRLGHRQLAARALANLPPERAAEVALLRAWLARSTFIRMVESFRSYQDQSALGHGERLLRLYPGEAKELPQARPLAEDLKRRQRQGR